MNAMKRKDKWNAFKYIIIYRTERIFLPYAII